MTFEVGELAILMNFYKNHRVACLKNLTDWLLVWGSDVNCKTDQCGSWRGNNYFNAVRLVDIVIERNWDYVVLMIYTKMRGRACRKHYILNILNTTFITVLTSHLPAIYVVTDCYRIVVILSFGQKLGMQ